MTKNINICLNMASIIILLYCLIISLICSSSTASFLDSKFHLKITNNMDPGRVLKTRCTSNNKEDGQKKLHHGESMSMDLKDELFDRTEVACDFLGSGSEKKGLSGHFEVFVEGKTGYGCGDVCKYSARENGLWFYDFRDAEWEFKGAWVQD